MWVVAGATDMRRSFDGLSAQIQTQLAGDPFSRQVFVFKDRQGDQINYSSGTELASFCMPRGWKEPTFDPHTAAGWPDMVIATSRGSHSNIPRRIHERTVIRFGATKVGRIRRLEFASPGMRFCGPRDIDNTGTHGPEHPIATDKECHSEQLGQASIRRLTRR